MDMSSSATGAGAASGTANDIEGWKPYLHTSLFSPFSNVPASGEAFLFPTFRIYSRSTFLAACAFTFTLALLERWLTFLLDRVLSLEEPASVATGGQGWTAARRANATRAGGAASARRTAGGGSVYIHLPATEAPRFQNLEKGAKPTAIKLVARNAVFFAATLLRYVLMIIGMGMDWFMLLSVVSGLTLGHLLTDLYVVSKMKSQRGAERGAEELELLQQDFDAQLDEDDGEDGEKLERREDGGQGAGLGATHRRSTSRQTNIAVTP
ncbi:hypothetical protein EX895_002169 [Sporisorium graminicola]|uniref:Copper transport protein n=1 Tax=Sporisorium graminicola TaxID=280036 RepID=A0A4U7KZM1_9BASI|nr:hypothetical protein EX895_002169 [Sporisorium graminicola]TKY88928.1 hypothetical protein EX895_002169 [Sporisorium graminicola]